MKPEDALESLCKDCVDFPCYALPHGDRCPQYHMLKKAREKQIPMKPKLFRLNDWFYEADCECGEVLYTWQVYCPICGQAIDWSDFKDD